MNRSQLTYRLEMDDLALGLALRGWVVRLETGRLVAPGAAGHVVVDGGSTSGQYVVRPAGRRREVGVRRGGALSLLGVAFDIDEVHSLIRHDIAAQHPSRPAPTRPALTRICGPTYASPPGGLPWFEVGMNPRGVTADGQRRPQRAGGGGVPPDPSTALAGAWWSP